MSGGSFSHVSVHVGDGWHVRTAIYPNSTPILEIDAGPSYISISLRRNETDKAAVEFARALADEAQKFAAEVERMHAARLAGTEGTDKAAGSDAA
jgi:hypothetical protein